MTRHILALALAATASHAADIFVSPSAAPGGDGSRARPFANVESALAACAEARRDRPGDPVTIHLAAGRYLSRDGFRLGAEHSGSESAAVTLRAAEGADVRLASGVQVPPSAFKPVADEALLARMRPEARGQVARVDLGALGIDTKRFKDVFRKLEVLEVFSGTTRLPISRWPNGAAFTTMERVTDNGVNPPRPGVFVYRGAEPERWMAALSEDQLWIRGFWRVPWAIEAARVAKIDPAEKTITFAAPISGGIGSKYKRGKDGVGAGSGEEPWHALNLLEEIDRPGEWAIDFNRDSLFLWPDATAAAEGLLLADSPKPVVAFSGVSHATLRGVTVECGRGNGVEINGGSRVTVAGCRVRLAGDCGVRIVGGTGHAVVSGEIHDCGQEGIWFTGGTRRTLTPGEHLIANNHIHHIGIHFPAAAIVAGAGTQSETVGNRIAHNRIHDVPSAGIVFAGNNNVMELNEIYRVGLGSKDLGAFYTNSGWTARGNVIRHNLVHHAMNANAYYLDDGSSGTLVEGNITYKAESGGFIGGGHDHTLRNNIFAACTRGVHVDDRGVSRKYTPEDRRLSTDLKSVPYQEPPWSTAYPTLATILDRPTDIPSGIVIENNLIAGCKTPVRRSGKPAHFEAVTFRDNVETESVAMLANPDTLDFAVAVAPEFAQALAGLAGIPVAKIGLQPDDFRKELPARDVELIRTAPTDKPFDSQIDVDASNRQ